MADSHVLCMVFYSYQILDSTSSHFHFRFVVVTVANGAVRDCHIMLALALS